MSNVKTDIRFLKGVGEKRAEILSNMGIDTVGALLRFYPRAYEDFSKITQIFDCNYNEKVCVKATVITEISEQYIRKNMSIYKFAVADESGSMNITIFNNKYLAARLKKGRTYLFLGKLSPLSIIPAMSSPEIREVGSVEIEPIYRAVKNLGVQNFRKMVKNALMCEMGDDPIPQEILEKYKLLDLKSALNNIHFPKSQEALERAKHRLVFEELFVLQLSLNILKRKHKRQSPCVITEDFSLEFEKLLPFSLTEAQQNAIKDCVLDMKSGLSMNRLIQGDVGSGKTAVAASLIYSMAKNKFQSALMAPTEILAEQHFNSLTSLFYGSNIRVCLLTGSMTKTKKQKVKEGLKNGEYDIVVGTHALLTVDTEFNNLGLVITDEQHRFGVNQRTELSSKGKYPHTLVMSATPIPGTLAMVLYGDLDVSIINQYPKGRKPIETYLVSGDKRQRAYNYIKKHINEGRQAYIVCPLVEESEKSELISAEEYFKSLTQNEFSSYKLGLLHGKMKPKDKEKVMSAFSKGEIDLLVCTTVVEVGVDVPNAAIMIIENAECFGLSQLHQLRGRIGRGEHQSTCILFSDALGGETEARLKILTDNTDGFKIADEDLKLRGPGDFLGSRQHGLPPMRIADIFADTSLLKITGVAAEEVLKLDPALKHPKNSALRQEVIDFYNRLNKN